MPSTRLTAAFNRQGCRVIPCLVGAFNSTCSLRRSNVTRLLEIKLHFKYHRLVAANRLRNSDFRRFQSLARLIVSFASDHLRSVPKTEVSDDRVSSNLVCGTIFEIVFAE